MQKISTMRASGKTIFEGQLTIGLDLGDRSSAYCILNEAGEIVLEHKLATTPSPPDSIRNPAYFRAPLCRDPRHVNSWKELHNSGFRTTQEVHVRCSFMPSLFFIGRHVRRHAPWQEFTE